MVLVPEENILQFSSHRSHNFTNDNGGSAKQAEKIIEAALSRLDAEMNEILKSNAYADEREKWLAYFSVLQRYLHFADEERAHQYHALVKKKEGSAQFSPTKSDIPTARMNDSIIIESVPLKFRNKAKLLLRRLHDAPPSDFSWDSAGVVSASGEPIKDSNIVDLVNDAMRARKVAKPAGRKVFAKFLRSIQTPREFVGNEELWQESRANSTLQSRCDSATDENDGAISDIGHSEFYSGSESSKSDRSIQNGSGGGSCKRRRVTWASLKLSV